jgi:hypothetical protein
VAPTEEGDGWTRPTAPPGWVPPPGTPGWTAPTPGQLRRRRSTNAWITAAIVLVVLIPIGFVAAIVWLFAASSSAAEADPGGNSGEWLPLAALFGFAVWAVACGLAAFTCVLIGAARVRHP